MKKSHTITFRGKAARLAFEAITGTKLPPKPESVAARLTKHLAGDGTPNDLTTDALYREANRIPADAYTDADTVEKWAFETVNSHNYHPMSKHAP